MCMYTFLINSNLKTQYQEFFDSLALPLNKKWLPYYRKALRNTTNSFDAALYHLFFVLINWLYSYNILIRIYTYNIVNICLDVTNMNNYFFIQAPAKTDVFEEFPTWLCSNIFLFFFSYLTCVNYVAKMTKKFLYNFISDNFK